jgi:hypothetical protein
MIFGPVFQSRRALQDEQDRELAELKAEYQANPPMLTDEDVEEISGCWHQTTRRASLP